MQEAPYNFHTCKGIIWCKALFLGGVCTPAELLPDCQSGSSLTTGSLRGGGMVASSSQGYVFSVCAAEGGVTRKLWQNVAAVSMGEVGMFGPKEREGGKPFSLNWKVTWVSQQPMIKHSSRCHVSKDRKRALRWMSSWLFVLIKSLGIRKCWLLSWQPYYKI